MLLRSVLGNILPDLCLHYVFVIEHLAFSPLIIYDSYLLYTVHVIFVIRRVFVYLE